VFLRPVGAAVAVLAGLAGVAGPGGLSRPARAAGAGPAPVAAPADDAPLAPPAPAVAWHAAATVEQENNLLTVVDLVADPSGATTTLHYLQGSVRLGGPGSPTFSATPGATDLLLVHRDPVGTTTWVHRVSGIDGPAAAIAGAGDGGVVLAFNHAGAVALDSRAPLPLPQPTTGGTAVMAFDATGGLAWWHRFDGPFPDLDVDAHPTGGVLLSGHILRDTEIGRAAAVPDDGSSAVYAVVRLTTDGAVAWTRGVSGTRSAKTRWTSAGEVAVLADDTGLNQPILFALPGDAWTFAPEADPTRGFVVLARLDARGGRRSAVRSVSNRNWEFSDLAATPDGGLVIAGQGGAGTLSWGDATVPIDQPEQFVLRLDAAGTLRWHVTYGHPASPGYAAGTVAVAPDGSVAAMTPASEAVAVDLPITTPTGSAHLPTPAVPVSVVLALTPDGTLRWADSSRSGSSGGVRIAYPGGGAGPAVAATVDEDTAVGHDPAHVVPASTVLFAYGAAPAAAPCAPDLVTTVTPASPEVLATGQITVEFAVANRSTACTAEDTIVDLALPTGWWALPTDPDIYQGDHPQWWVGRVAPGATRRVQLPMETDRETVRSGTVSATAATWFRQGDAHPGDERGAATITVVACQPDLHVQLTAPTVVNTGERAVLNLRVTNTGNCPVGDSVALRIPPGTPLLAFPGEASGDGNWGFQVGGREPTWYGYIAAGATVAGAVPVVLTAPVDGPVTITAELEGRHGYPDPGPNSTTATLGRGNAQPGTLTGTVTGPDGPAAGVSVLASPYPGSQWATAASAVTDAQGHYRIDGLPAGAYKLRTIDFAGRYENAWVYGLTATGATLQLMPSSGTGKVDITVITRPTGGIVGDVFAPDGKPLAGLWVELFGAGDTSLAVTSTDANGVYLFGSLRDGVYHVLLWDTTGRYPARYQSGWPFTNPDTWLSVQNGQVQLVRTNFT
jgi:hypothetical protein